MRPAVLATDPTKGTALLPQPREPLRLPVRHAPVGWLRQRIELPRPPFRGSRYARITASLAATNQDSQLIGLGLSVVHRLALHAFYSLHRPTSDYLTVVSRLIAMERRRNKRTQVTNKPLSSFLSSSRGVVEPSLGGAPPAGVPVLRREREVRLLEPIKCV